MRIVLFCLLVTLIINTPTVFAEHNEKKDRTGEIRSICIQRARY